MHNIYLVSNQRPIATEDQSSTQKRQHTSTPPNLSCKGERYGAPSKQTSEPLFSRDVTSVTTKDRTAESSTHASKEGAEGIRSLISPQLYDALRYLRYQKQPPLTPSEIETIHKSYGSFLDNCQIDILLKTLAEVYEDSREQLYECLNSPCDKDKTYWLLKHFLDLGTDCDYQRVLILKELLSHSGQNTLASLLPVRSCTSQLPALKQKIFEMISNNTVTNYDLWLILRNNQYTVFRTVDELKDEQGHNLLHLAVDKCRKSFFYIFLCMGCWDLLSSQKVPDKSASDHRGKSALQIAESIKATKYAQEYRKCSALERSLTSLMKAARKGDDVIVKQMILQNSPELHSKDKNNGNALYWAVVSGQLNTLQLLLNAGLDHTLKTSDDETLLHVACKLGHSDVAKLLLESVKADGQDKDASGKTVFDICAENGDITTLKELSKKLYVPESTSVVAAFNGRMPFLKYCIEQLKMPVDSMNEFNKSPLHTAIKGEHVDIVKYLLSKGANITLRTAMHENVLHIACLTGNITLLKLLIEKLKTQHKQLFDSMLNEQDRFHGTNLIYLVQGRDRGRAAYHYVEVERQHRPIFLKEVNSGATDVAKHGKVLTSQWGESPDRETRDWITNIPKEKKLDKTSPLDQTPLHIAIDGGHNELANLLLSQEGVKIGIKDSFGLTPAMMSASLGDIQLLQRLDQMNCSLDDVTLSGESITGIAVANKHEKIIIYLESKKGQQTNEFSQSIINYMADNYSPEKIAKLKEQGVDVKKHMIERTQQLISQANTFS